MRKLSFFISLSFALLTSGCATIISGSKQVVRFSSTPKNATILIDEVEVGKTPLEIRLPRKREYAVMIKLDGYRPYETKLTKTFNAWYIGNLAIGGLIGLIIDPITGAIYNLTPKEINARLRKGTAFKSSNTDVYVAVSLEIDKSWNKVGQLEKR